MPKQRTEQQELTREEKMLRGTAWSTFSDFVSRLLGAFYIIPWYIWMGQAAPQANALFAMGYNVYTIFLVLSTTGLNVAVAKQVAKYNAIGQETKSMALTRSFLKVMVVSGALFALVLYLGAPLFASMSGAGAELVSVLRSLTLAVLVFPAMSVLRGLFQGYNNIKPNALSQMAEQLIRVIWMLLTAFFIMRLGSQDYVKAVTQSTFAAFVGMIASMAVLVYYLWKENLLTKLLAKDSSSSSKNDNVKLLLETVKEAVPFIITGAAIQLYALVDQVTFINTMLRLTRASREELTVMYSYLSANPNKIIMIIVSIAASIGGVGIALLTESFVQKDKKGTARLILNNFQMLMTFILPALTGSILLAAPLYSFFYGSSEPLAIGLFVAILVQALFQCFYVMLSPMLHAIFESKQAILYCGYGFLTKLITQLPTLYLFKAYGPVVSTSLGLLVPIALMYRHLHRTTRFNHRIIVKNALLTSLLTLAMAIPVVLARWGLSMVLPSEGRLSSTLYLLICGCVGILVYGFLALKTRSIDKLLGSRAASLRQKLHIN